MPYNLTTMQSIFCNNKEITEIRCNGSLVYKKQSGPDYTEPFYVENISNADETLKISKGIFTSAPTLTIECSTDKENWEPLGVTSTEIRRTITPGNKLYLKCNTNNWCEGDSYNSIIGTSKIGGNIMSLLYGDQFADKTSFPSGSTYNFKCLFSNNTNLVDASELLLPATTLASECYDHMFNSCYSLTAAPALPATTLATRCYNSMFRYCTSLTAAPALPATTLAYWCYSNMFNECNALTSAPSLPATTLTTSCYDSMFYGCRSLTQAPALPATTLADGCYKSMFQYCTSLTAAPALPATTLTSACYNNMFSYCFSLTTAPALPVTTLASECYEGMFQNCTSLTAAPALPATTLVEFCYTGMFNGCTLLTNVTCLATAGVYENYSTFGWLNEVSSTGTFTKAAGVNWPTGSNGIPEGWTVVEV